MKKCAGIIFFFFVLFGEAICQPELHQPPQPLQEKLTFYLLDRESGLYNNVINNVEQDSLGFIWIATDDGLSRYDGMKFREFLKSDKEKGQGISNNLVKQIRLNKSGNILFATDGGINIYNPRLDHFTVLDTHNGLWSNSVSAFELGPNEDIIIGAYNMGLQIADKDGHYTYYSHNSADAMSISSNRISSLLIQGDSVLWIGTFDNGLCKMNYKTKEISRVNLSQNTSSSGSTINCLFSDTEGNVWIGSKNGVDIITKEQDTLQIRKSSLGTGLSDDDVLCFQEDGMGKMWIGTRNGGLNVLDKSSLFNGLPEFNVMWFLPAEDGSSVYNRTITSLKLDSDSNMWIGTYTGLNFVNPRGETIKLLQKRAGVGNSLSHNRISSLARSENGNVWIGTDGGGLDLYNPGNGKFQHFVNTPSNLYSLSNNYILSLLEDEDHLWVGTYRGGINRMNRNTGRCTHYLQGRDDEGSDVRAIYKDSKANIWVGTNRGGLYLYNESSDTFKYISTLGKLDIREICEDGKGNLWMATWSGILRYHPQKEEAEFFSSSNTPEMSSNVVFSILCLPNGNILAGTRYGGLVRLNPDKKEVKSFTRKDGLTNNTINSMVLADSNTVWMGTLHGICKYDIHTDEIRNINSFENIQQSEFNIGAVLKTPNGDLYFGGNKGLNVFNPEKLNSSESSYPIILEKLSIFNKEVSVEENDEAILQQALPYQNHVTLAYDQSLFSVDLVTLKYPKAKNITYSYLLEGYNNYWIDGKNSGTINLSNIPPGNYTLKVKASIWPNKESYKELFISITPPWWLTWPAYLLYALVLALIIWGTAKYYSERLKLKNSLIIEKKQRQLEHSMNAERVRFFTSFSHELKTPLTLILNPLEDLIRGNKNPKDLANLFFIKKNTKYLFQSINRLLEFRKTEVGFNEVEIQSHNISGFLEEMIDNYRPLANSRDINLSLTKDNEHLEAWFDLEKLKIILHNLLSNAFKHCQKNDTIEVLLTHDSSHFNIQIKDTGAGIRAEDIDHIFDWYFQSNAPKKTSGSGIGLSLSKTFAELHNGKIFVQSEFGQGASFTLRMPINDPELRHSPRKAARTETSSDESAVTALDIWGPQEVQEIKPWNDNGSNYKKDKKLVLLIDDNQDILNYLAGIFQGKFNILLAKDGKEGLDKAVKYVPDLIVSDVMMPHKSGFDVCRSLKDKVETSHIPIILLTAKDNKESMKEGFDEGADEYLTKPFDSQILIARAENLIENRLKLKEHFFSNLGAFENLSKEQTNILSREKEFLNKLEGLILEQIAGGTTDVNSISSGMGMSRTSLFRKLKAITGHNINEFIRKVKINKAAHLIEKEGYGVSQAAYEVGFSSVKYFRKVFQQELGRLPSELAKKENAV